MKMGMRTPSLRKSIAARASLAPVRPAKPRPECPRGFGWFTDPCRAAYNRIYNRVTFGWRDVLSG